MSWQSVLTPIFEPLLKMSPVGGLAIITFIISLIINIAYKYLTDQKLMKQLKEDIKNHQQEMKQHKDHPHKVLELQKAAMEKNMQYMVHTLKPTLITLLPLLIIFGWLNANVAYEPIRPGENFTISIDFDKAATGNAQVIAITDIDMLDEGTKPIMDTVSWKFRGNLGEHLIEWKINDKSYTTTVLISDKQEYAPVVKRISDNTVKQIRIENSKKIFLNLFGWKLGWLGTYIIFSVIFSMGLRKIMGLH